MANSKPKKAVPQAKHKTNSTRSQFDKVDRLANRVPGRQTTERARFPLVGQVASLAKSTAKLLDDRIGFRLPILIAGILLAKGRCTVACWLRAAGVKGDWDRFYDLLQSIGRNATVLMLPLIYHIMSRFASVRDQQMILAVDDTPTKRYGKHVEAANVHRNPTAGPADGEWLYGHNWVCLALLLPHRLFGTTALPLLSKLYVRKESIEQLKPKYGWKFKTKHQLALEMVREVLRAFGTKARKFVTFDGAYFANELIRPLLREGVTVVTRLRRDAKLFDLPRPSKGKGRPRKYGKSRISLSKRAGQRGGWQTTMVNKRGMNTELKYKTFTATNAVVGGAIRIVLVEYNVKNWAAYMCTDPSMTVESIMEIVFSRWAIEETFHDLKEVWGAGEQQVRNIWSNIGCWHLCTWIYSMVELASWDETHQSIVDRSDRPWDNPNRRPSHRDRKRKIAHEMLQNEFLNPLLDGEKHEKLRHYLDGLLALAA